jgi:hypothetical protein
MTRRDPPAIGAAIRRAWLAVGCGRPEAHGHSDVGRRVFRGDGHTGARTLDARDMGVFVLARQWARHPAVKEIEVADDLD